MNFKKYIFNIVCLFTQLRIIANPKKRFIQKLTLSGKITQYYQQSRATKTHQCTGRKLTWKPFECIWHIPCLDKRAISHSLVPSPIKKTLQHIYTIF